jgi:bifunctional UDP-N-acetylglucosamine pyrophosphorylase / glucosamine-1-phosphate N-acetyltransferase
MAAGVTMIDAASITIDDTVEIGNNAIIEPQTHLRGNTKIGAGVRVGPGSLIENSSIGDQSAVLYSVIIDSQVGSSVKVGPYAHLRQEAVVGDGCRVGNFVELKKSTLGNGTNVAHLSYLGDTTTGLKVNIGAGTITANYDGRQKHQTTIGNHSKTGSNSVLVAPLKLGDNVTVAAGSTVTEDVGNDSLVVARSRQVVKPGWKLDDNAG